MSERTFNTGNPTANSEGRFSDSCFFQLFVNHEEAAFVRERLVPTKNTGYIFILAVTFHLVSTKKNRPHQ